MGLRITEKSFMVGQLYENVKSHNPHFGYTRPLPVYKHNTYTHLNIIHIKCAIWFFKLFIIASLCYNHNYVIGAKYSRTLTYIGQQYEWRLIYQPHRVFHLLSISHCSVHYFVLTKTSCTRRKHHFLKNASVLSLGCPCWEKFYNKHI